MSQRPRTTSANLRERPRLVAAVAFASLATVLAMSTVAAGSGIDLGETAFYGIAPVLFTAVGALILAQVPGHGVGRLAITIGLVLAISASLMFLINLVDPVGPVQVVLAGPAGTVLEVAIALSQVLPSIALFIGGAILVVWFPDGRAASRLGLLSQVLVLVAIAGAVVLSLQDVLLRSLGYSPSLDVALRIAFVVVFGGLAAAYVVALLDLANRYQHADPLRRTQMRWVLAAVSIELVLTFLAFLFSEHIGWLWSAWIASSILPIIAIAIAITRYHLYDIDRIISRTIAYSLISVVLLGVLVVAVVALQAILEPLTNGDTIAVAASTLAVAALFQPVRTRIQRAVDRRFHRARYDAERTVEGFAGRLRDELDLPTLVTELRRVAVEAVEPSMTGIWLRTGGPG
jgi:hypothetical protein